MSKIIIGIHGMGNKPDSRQLQSWWESALLEGLGSNMHHWSFKFQMVYWATVLHQKPYDLTVLDNKDPLYLKEPYTKAGAELIIKEEKESRKQIRELINEQLDRIFLEEDGSLNFTGLTDFILRHFVKDLDAYYSDEPGQENYQQSRERIHQQLAEILIKNRRKKILLIAHSMGSIIALDVLNRYASDIKIHTLVTIGSPLGNPVVQSKMLSDVKINSSELSLMKTPENIKNAWFNLADFKDKVAFNYKLTKDFLPNHYHVQPRDMLVSNNYEYKGEPNPHKSYGYLRCPEMASIISEFLRWQLPGEFKQLN
ncbi:MAG: alpha/beta hydrolase [Spirochaetia bacterium]|jgi:hypothetical protein|nr:alpha/beta hydrolase [Spirochaetia bacterium]